MRLLLDTNLLLQRPNFDLLQHPSEEIELFTASICYAEVLEGEYSDDAAVRARAPLDYLNAQATYGEGLEFNDSAAQRYRVACNAVKQSGRSIKRRRVDLMIAAVAMAYDCALATRNTDDFIGLESVLQVIPL